MPHSRCQRERECSVKGEVQPAVRHMHSVTGSRALSAIAPIRNFQSRHMCCMEVTSPLLFPIWRQRRKCRIFST